MPCTEYMRPSFDVVVELWLKIMHIGCAGLQSTLKSPVVSITEIVCSVVS